MPRKRISTPIVNLEFMMTFFAGNSMQSELDPILPLILNLEFNMEFGMYLGILLSRLRRKNLSPKCFTDKSKITERVRDVLRSQNNQDVVPRTLRISFFQSLT